MNTTNDILQKSTSERRPSSVQQHNANRELSTNQVLNHLWTRLPRQYELAEVVGQWVWLAVSPARQPVRAKMLWALGFHWNQRRCVWQHPCGACAPYEIHPQDPRKRYGSFFAADVLPA